jgi:hypothetical protein
VVEVFCSGVPPSGQPHRLPTLLKEPRHHHLEKFAAYTLTFKSWRDEQRPDVSTDVIGNPEGHHLIGLLVDAAPSGLLEHRSIMLKAHTILIGKRILANGQAHSVHGVNVVDGGWTEGHRNRGE